jgi:aspartate kinase
MRILVQKFGGTSVRSGEMRAAAIDKIAAAREGGFSPVVVVSAIGRKGEPYATDTLLQFARSEAGGEVCPRENDLLMSCGEIISAVVMAASLTARGIPARAVTGWQAGIFTNERFGSAAYTEVETSRLLDMLESGVVPVVTGFQGITKDGDVTTLGRGGSDTTAAILGLALRAEAVEIFTDVDGVMTADPRLLPEARVIKGVSYNEVFQMADHGARVIHPRAVEIAMRGNVPLIVRNTAGDASGTRISADSYPEETQDVLSGIAYAGGRVQVKVRGMTSVSEKDLLGALASAGISIDLINIFPESVVVTIDEDKTEKARALLDSLKLDYEIISGLGKVSAIGERMRGVPGVMARIIRALTGEGVAVLQTADSHMTISCLIREEDAQRAVRALHGEFMQQPG